MNKPELTLEAIKQCMEYMPTDYCDQPRPTLRAYPGELKLETLAEWLMQENKKKVQQQLETGPIHNGITHWTLCLTIPNVQSQHNLSKAIGLLMAACNDLLEPGAHK